jgi:hypothetical protein
MLTVSKNIELLETSTPSGSDRKEDWPCDTRANKADDGDNLQESEEKVAV